MLKLKELFFGLGLIILISSQQADTNNILNFQLTISEYRTLAKAQSKMKTDLEALLVEIQNLELAQQTSDRTSSLEIKNVSISSKHANTPSPIPSEVMKNVCFNSDEIAYNKSTL